MLDLHENLRECAQLYQPDIASPHLPPNLP
ncbi:hypothetical protein GQ600_19486 [Phytophthora cactorum]|nr:hypothetical protein GQ600_19486 [Phytophthora cactorum]